MYIDIFAQFYVAVREYFLCFEIVSKYMYISVKVRWLQGSAPLLRLSPPISTARI